MSSSSSKDKDPSDIHPGLKCLDYINPKLGSMYFRFNPGENLRYASTDAFLAWKTMPSTKSSTDGRPFYIFLHDYGSSARIFNRVTSRIPNFCLALDFKGWGRSDDTKDENNLAYSITQMKNQIPPLVHLLQGEHFLLVGHGMGAKVALLYASQQPPQNLIGLVLLAPAPLSPFRPPLQLLEKYKAAYTNKNAENYLKSFIKTTLSSSPIDDTDLQNLIEDGTKDTPLAKAAWLTYGIAENHFHALKRIKIPVMIRAGADDKVLSLTDWEADAEELTMLLHLEVQGVGHLMPLEDLALPSILIRFCKDMEDVKAGLTVFGVKVARNDSLGLFS